MGEKKTKVGSTVMKPGGAVGEERGSEEGRLRSELDERDTSAP